MGMPASSFFIGTLLNGAGAVVVPVFRDLTIQMISAIRNTAKRTLCNGQVSECDGSLGSVYVRHDCIESLFRGNRSTRSRVVSAAICMIPPRLQHVPWSW